MGIFLSEKTVQNYENGKLKTYKTFHANGNLASVINYDENGNQHGKQETFHANGNLASVTNYENGMQKQKMFYPDGKLQSETNTKTGMGQGEWKLFDKNGNLIDSFSENDMKNGEMKSFIAQRGFVIITNLKTREQKTFDENGNLTGVKNF